MRILGRLLLGLLVLVISYFAIVIANAKTENVVCQGTFKWKKGQEEFTSTNAILGIQIEKLSRLAFWVNDENDQRANVELLRDLSDPQTPRQYTLVNVEEMNDLFILISDKNGMMTYYSNRSNWVSFVDRSPGDKGQDDTIESFGGACERGKPLFS